MQQQREPIRYYTNLKIDAAARPLPITKTGGLRSLLATNLARPVRCFPVRGVEACTGLRLNLS